MSSSNRQTLAFSSLISASSSLVGPCSWPASIWACLAQRRTDSLPTPSRRATAVAAAVSDGYSDRRSRTRRTQRSLTDGSIFFGMTRILPTHNDTAWRTSVAAHRFNRVTPR